MREFQEGRTSGYESDDLWCKVVNLQLPVFIRFNIFQPRDEYVPKVQCNGCDFCARVINMMGECREYISLANMCTWIIA